MLNYILLCLSQACIYLPLVIGSFISISLMKVPDLSLESAFTAGAIAGYLFLKLNVPLSSIYFLPLVIAISCLGGMIVGLISSSLTSYCRFAHLLSSIITTGLFHGINLLVLGTCNASFIKCSNPFDIKVFDYSVSESSTIALIVGGLYFLFVIISKSQLGLSFSIYGRNKNFFKRHGISERYVFMTGILLSNGLVGIAGFLAAYTQGFVDTSMGLGIALLALTALILGKVISSSLSTLIPLVGVSAYFVIQQSLLHVGFDLKFFTTVQAALILIVLVFYYRSDQRQTIDHLGV